MPDDLDEKTTSALEYRNESRFLRELFKLCPRTTDRRVGAIQVSVFRDLDIQSSESSCFCGRVL